MSNDDQNLVNNQDGFVNEDEEAGTLAQAQSAAEGGRPMNVRNLATLMLQTAVDEANQPADQSHEIDCDDMMLKSIKRNCSQEGSIFVAEGYNTFKDSLKDFFLKFGKDKPIQKGDVEKFFAELNQKRDQLKSKYM